MQGAYNAVAPEDTTNAQFKKTIARVLKKPIFFPRVPEFFIRLFFGESAQIILEGSRISSQKIQDAGFEFKYKTLKIALKDILIKGKDKKKK